jgi:TolA-binding protein
VIRIAFRDALPQDADRIVPFTSAPFQTRWTDGNRVLIVLHTEFVVNGMFDVQAELVHELTHAALRLRMGRNAYAAVPQWLREALAVWAADQVDRQLAAVLRKRDNLDRPSKAFSGLDAPEHSTARYAEYGLAAEFIAQQAGPQGLKKLVDLIIAGTPPREALHVVAPLSWRDFVSACRKYAEDRARRARATETEEYVEILRLDRRRDYKNSKRLCAQFLKQHHRSPLRGDVLYWHGKACRLLRQRGPAERSLRELLRKHRQDTTMVEEALYQLGALLVEARAHRRAIEPFKRLLRDHPDSTLLDRAVYNLAFCRAKTGDKREARRLLSVFERSFPGSSFAGKARELRASLGTGRP